MFDLLFIAYITRVSLLMLNANSLNENTLTIDIAK